MCNLIWFRNTPHPLSKKWEIKGPLNELNWYFRRNEQNIELTFLNKIIFVLKIMSVGVLWQSSAKPDNWKGPLSGFVQFFRTIRLRGAKSNHCETRSIYAFMKPDQFTHLWKKSWGSAKPGSSKKLYEAGQRTFATAWLRKTPRSGEAAKPDICEF